jgi:hypothetical protein
VRYDILNNLSWDFSYFIIWISPILLFILVISSCKAMALLSSVHDTLPQIYLITDGSVDDEHNICRTTKTDLSNRGSRSPRISTFGLGNNYCAFQSKHIFAVP